MESLQVKEYELYVPLSYNDGSSIESEKLLRIRARLLEQFGSLTFFPQHNDGFWTMGGVTFRDSIVIYRVVTDKTRTARKFFRQLKEELKTDLKQEEIFIVEKDVNIL
jgi:hypothetical protein